MTTDRPVTIIVQTRVRAGEDDSFSLWQGRIGKATSEQAGFLGQSILPPNPPAQTDWVILQRFSNAPAALAWLNSERRLALLTEGQALLVGVDDVHLVTDVAAGALPAPVSVVFATRLKPGGEPAFRAWQQRVAAAQTRAPGFQGYRFEPPIPGVQDDWLAILRFDTEENLEKWLGSSPRLELLKETDAFTAEVHTRVVRTGFEQWFQEDAALGQTPAWKQNMIVVALLYPVVFLFGLWVQAPILMRWMGLPFWLSLFIGNVVSVLLLNKLVPWAGGRLRWWLNPAPAGRRIRTDVAGACLIAGFYAVCLAVFAVLG